MAATGNAALALLTGGSEEPPLQAGPPPARSTLWPATAPASVAPLLAAKVALVTACPRFSQRLHRDFLESRAIALRVQPIPEEAVSIHRLACDCSAGLLIVDAALLQVGRVLPGDPVSAARKSVHLILAFSSVDRTAVEVALAARAHGCVDFDIPSLQLTRAIAVVLNGDLWFPRWMARCFYERAMATARPESPSEPDTPESNVVLTQREVEVMRLLRRGLTNKEIGRELCISPNTVKKHVHGALQKLGLIHRRQAF